MNLSYNKVFDRYKLSFTDKLAEVSRLLYRKIRLRLAKVFPLSDFDQKRFEYSSSFVEESTDIPQGFDYISNKNENGFIKLDFIDIYDYLPKEDLPKFIKELKKCVHRNKITPFSTFRSRAEIERLNNFGRYYDGQSFSNILSIQLRKSSKLQQSCSHISISIRNLSATFLVVKYRIYTTTEFNKKIEEICNKKYSGFTTVVRQFNTPWYNIKKFGEAYHDGNNARQKELYDIISKLKWQALKEIRKNFTVRFWNDKIFTPTFETYSTNIRPSDNESNLEYWGSISFGSRTDYAPEYNACVCWDYKHSNYEGIRLAAYCGGNYTKKDHYPEIARHHLSDIYAVYLTASTLNAVSERDIAICNKKISKVIRKSKTSSVLKARVAVERYLYYSYRFISEFSGKSIDPDEAQVFKHQFYKKGSVSSRCLEKISNRTKESKNQIDTILKLLNDAAEYRSSESNIKLQWIMMIVTFISLIITLLSINNTAVLDLFKNALEYVRDLF